MPVRLRTLHICFALLVLLNACAAQVPHSNDGVGRVLGTLRRAREASNAKQWTKANPREVGDGGSRANPAHSRLLGQSSERNILTSNAQASARLLLSGEEL